jgi:integrase
MRADAVQFTVDRLHLLQSRLGDRARREVGDTRDYRLRARITPDSVTFVTWRNEYGLRACIKLGVLGRDFGIADARRKLDEIHRRPISVVANRRTFGEVAKAYHEKRLARTKRGGEQWASIERNVLPTLRHRLVRDITGPMVRDLVEGIGTRRVDVKTGRTVGGPGAARQALRAVRAILSRAVIDKDADFNAAAGLTNTELGIKQERRVRWLDEKLMPEFLDAVGLHKVLARKKLPDGSVAAQVRLGLVLLAYVPVRSGSLVGARVEELQLKPPAVGQPPTWTIPPARLKGGRVPQVLPLPETAVAILKEPVRLAEKAGTPYLLPSPVDPAQPLAPKTLTQAFRRMERTGRVGFAAEPGEEALTLHRLRASWRSWAQELGVPADVAELCMGHVGGLQRMGFSGAAPLYARSRALQRQAAVPTGHLQGGGGRIRPQEGGPGAPGADARVGRGGRRRERLPVLGGGLERSHDPDCHGTPRNAFRGTGVGHRRRARWGRCHVTRNPTPYGSGSPGHPRRRPRVS